MNFDLNLYKTFYVVAKYNSFTKASQELYISQPAVTQSIKKLENQLNVELFKRTSNGIELTKAGEIVYFYAEKLCDIASANTELLKVVKKAAFDSINIGVPTHIGSFYLIKYLKQFNSKYPNIKINIINKKTDEMIKMLEKRELDLVVDTHILNRGSSLIEIVKIKDLEGCFVCNKKVKEKINVNKICIKDLITYPIILPGKTTSNRKCIDELFLQKGIVLEPLIEVNSSTISKKIIEQGIGIGWMIKDFVKDDIEQGSLFELNIDVEDIVTPVCIAYNKNFNHEIIKEFIKLFKNEI